MAHLKYTVFVHGIPQIFKRCTRDAQANGLAIGEGTARTGNYRAAPNFQRPRYVKCPNILPITTKLQISSIHIQQLRFHRLIMFIHIK